MKVVLLCGGKGTRLREYTEKIPKPLIEVGGKPILWHIMKIYSHHGFNEFVLCLGYKGEMIKEYFAQHHWKCNDFTIKNNEMELHTSNEEDWKITFVDTGQNSSKSQRLSKIKTHINGENFLVAYGDDVSDVNIREVVNKHHQHGRIATLTAIPLHSQFGVLETNAENEIITFKEKPRLNNMWFNGGFFVFNKQIFDYLDKGELEKEVFEVLSFERQIVAYHHDGFWKCMNTFKDVQELNEHWCKGIPQWKVWQD
ncbi:MAG: glucose-1-phosphate cytidylyltransferase [Nanoarchaeota archaeon]|nr:glucose-1-phosphate cytidylyltransferase [Nanoarchaeota archaeon]